MGSNRQPSDCQMAALTSWAKNSNHFILDMSFSSLCQEKGRYLRGYHRLRTLYIQHKTAFEVPSGKITCNKAVANCVFLGGISNAKWTETYLSAKFMIRLSYSIYKYLDLSHFSMQAPHISCWRSKQTAICCPLNINFPLIPCFCTFIYYLLWWHSFNSLHYNVCTVSHSPFLLFITIAFTTISFLAL